MSRIRFHSAQVYENRGPGKGLRFPEGFVLDSAHVADILHVDNPSDDFASAFLRRWVNRNVAEYVGEDVAVSGPDDIVMAGGPGPVSVGRPFGTAKRGRATAGIESSSVLDPDGKPATPVIDYSALLRDELDKLAADRGVDIKDAKNKADVIAALQAADKPAE